MNTYSIAQLGRYAGVKPHTIRAWEKRYHVLTPLRSSGNSRCYNGAQMQRILNIVTLNHAGYRISELCSMPDEKLGILLEDCFGNKNDQPEEYFISQLIAAGTKFDDQYFNLIFNRCINRYPLNHAYCKVLLPMLNRLGLLWKCGKASVAHEHFISNLIRQKLSAAADSIPASPSSTSKWLLFLPENELHDIGLLMAYNLIRLAGQQAIYLGSNVPRQVLGSAVQQIKPDHLFIFLVNRHRSTSLHNYLTALDLLPGDETIYVASESGSRLIQPTAFRRIQWLTTVDEFTAVLPTGTA